MRIEKSLLRRRERDQCVSEIRTNENREKGISVYVRLGPRRKERSPMRRRERDQCVSETKSQ
jgi:hypothetical protein